MKTSITAAASLLLGLCAVVPMAALAEGEGATPLRFRLSVGLQPQMGDTTNPYCYSNVITRPAPSGWRADTWVPGAAGKAHAIVDAFKADFLAKCQAASGRNIDGAVSAKMNQSAYEDNELDTYEPRPGGTMVQID